MTSFVLDQESSSGFVPRRRYTELRISKDFNCKTWHNKFLNVMISFIKCRMSTKSKKKEQLCTKPTSPLEKHMVLEWSFVMLLKTLVDAPSIWYSDDYLQYTNLICSSTGVKLFQINMTDHLIDFYLFDLVFLSSFFYRMTFFLSYFSILIKKLCLMCLVQHYFQNNIIFFCSSEKLLKG